MSVIRILLLLSFVGVLPMASFAQSAAVIVQADTKPAEPISASNDIPPDIAIQRRIRGIFTEINTLSKVQVIVNSGVVTLKGEVVDQSAIEQAEILASRVEGVVAISNQLVEKTSVSERIGPLMERLQARIFQILNYIPLFSIALLIFGLIVFLGWWLSIRNWPFQHIAPNAFISGLLRQIVRLVFIGLGMVLALDIIGATALIGTVLGAAGIVGLAVGFAVRDTVENYIASILLSLRQPFRPNDAVQIGDYEGLVVTLTSRATILMSYDGNHVRIPNATVFKSIITNYTRNSERRFQFEIGIAPDQDAQQAMKCGLSILQRLDFVLKKPAPEAWVKDLGPSTIELWFGAWINQRTTSFARARGEAIRMVKTTLENNGFQLPEPTYRIHMTNMQAPVSPKPSQKIVQKKSVQLNNVDTSAQNDISDIVDEERAHMKDQDLLREEGLQEIG